MILNGRDEGVNEKRTDKSCRGDAAIAVLRKRESPLH
jgi:hypothetical protein